MSIKHFHALSEKRRNIFLSEPENFKCSEKLDGSNFIFGMTDDSLWAARKNLSEKFYSSSEWPDQMWAQNFKFTHMALENMRDDIKCSKTGDFVAYCEILSPRYPNTILYGEHGTQLVVYNGPQLLTGYTSFPIELLTSFDGRTIKRIQTIETTKLLGEKTSGLSATSIAKSLDGLSFDDQLLQIRGMLRQSTSVYNTARPEGFVLTHTDGWSFKLVDTEWFTEMNTRNYELRRKLFRTPRNTSNSVMDQFTRNTNQGMALSEAAAIAIAQLDQILEDYQKVDDAIEGHVHQRNLDATASLYHQLLEHIGGW
jgi:hypothetical protein